MAQKFFASPNHVTTCKNGAVGYRSTGFPDCLGPYAKVSNCPIKGIEVRLTCYATGYADTAFSVPACTRYKGKHIRGYFSGEEDGTVFNVVDAHKHFFQPTKES